MKLFIPDTDTVGDWRNQVEDDVVSLSSELNLSITVLGASENDEWLTFTKDQVTYNVHASVRSRGLPDDGKMLYDIFIRIFNTDGTQLLHTYNVVKSKFHNIDDYVNMYKQALLSSGILDKDISGVVSYNKLVNSDGINADGVSPGIPAPGKDF